MKGEKKFLWGMIIDEATNIRPYLDYILDKEIVVQSARKSVATVKEVLNKKPIDTKNNTISFLNGLTEGDLNTSNIKYRISVIT